MGDDAGASRTRRAVKMVLSLGGPASGAVAHYYRHGDVSWEKTISLLSTWELLGVLLLGPAVWIPIEFLDAFVTEAGKLARDGGAPSARLLWQAPKAFMNVLGRAWDSVVACLSRRSFDGRYRQRVYEDFGLFNDRGLGLINAARLDLERVFVELRVNSAHLIPTQMGLLRNPVEGRRTVWSFLGAVRPGCGLALIGPPGCGKTTLLQHVLLVFARNRQGRYRQRRLLPIMVELRHLTDALKRREMPSLAKAIRSYWRSSRLADLMAKEPSGWLERRLRASRVLLLFDGLDEVPQEQRAQVSYWVQEQMRREEYRHCVFLLTSRPAGYQEAPLRDATVLEVQPFSPEQTSNFIDGWYLANEIVASGNNDDEPVRRRAALEADDLRRRLRENASIGELTVNPLLLTMVCMVHRYNGALPGSRSQLYEEICRVLLERWRQVKSTEEELSGEQKLAVLRPLAAEFMQREARELAEKDICAIIDGPLTSVGYRGAGDAPAGAGFVHFIQSSSGLLLERERGRWSFAHKTFQEYLTAEHWLRSQKLDFDWSAKVPTEWWRETLLLFAARTDASALVEAALDEGSPASWGLAYQCLDEAQSLRREVRDRAEAILRQALRSTDPVVFTPAAVAFHRLNQRQLRVVSEKVEQRTSLVTQAEYQLFLDSLDLTDIAAMIPPHWTTRRFAGDPTAPILGISPLQAMRFAEWADRGTPSLRWRLAGQSELVDVALPTAVCWRSDSTLSPLPTVVSTIMEEWSGRWKLAHAKSFTLADALATCPDREALRPIDLTLVRSVGVALDRALDPVRAIHPAVARVIAQTIATHCVVTYTHDVVPTQDVSNSLALARQLSSAFDLANNHGFARDLDLARTLSRIVDRVLATGLALHHARDLVLKVARQIVGDREVLRRRALQLDVDLARLLDRSFACDSTCMRAISEELRQSALKDGDSVSGRLKKLFASLFSVLGAEDPFSARRAWRDCGLCLFEVARQQISRKYLDEVVPIEFALRMLSAREAGELQPYEGILMVRDRSSS